MNKFIIMGVIGLLLAFGIHAQHNTEQGIGPADTAYQSFSGTVQELREGENHTSILVQEEDSAHNSIVFNVLENVVLLDNMTQDFLKASDLKTGMRVTAYYPENTPVALSMPPIMTPQVIIVNSQRMLGFVHVGQFDGKRISDDGLLQLHISPETRITDKEGDVFTDDLAHHTLVVFYTVSTKSIPAQTTPQKIIVLN